jgi:hypothetical protein
MSQLPAPSPRLRESTAAALAPFFMICGDGDTDQARATATAMLEEYCATTPKELQLAAQIVAFDFAALACLGAAASVSNADLDVMLGLQDSAIALNALSAKSIKALGARRRERERAPQLMTAANTEWDNAGFQAAISRALEKMLYAATKLPNFAAPTAAPTPPAKRPILLSEPMTSSVLARMGAEASSKAGRVNAPRTRQ